MAPINLPDGSPVSEIVLPDGSTASEVLAPDGSTVFSAIPDSALTQDLKAWYRFEDGDARDYASSDEFPDVTWGDSTALNGNVNGATHLSTGGVTDFVNGTNSGAFDLDGTDEIRLPFSYGTPFTLLMWVNPRNTSLVGEELFNGRNGGNNGWFFRLIDDGGGNKMMMEEAATFNREFANSTVSLNTFSQLGVSCDTNGNLNFYLNGSPDGSGNHSNMTAGNDFVIGNRADISPKGDDMDAIVDDVRFYNRVLTDAEISDIYNATEP